MSLILNIETATTVCSVSLSDSGKVLAHRELDAGYTHAENLHLFIRQLLDEQQCDVKQLAAIAISRGPGSYTGLRIGSSAAKGLCFALNIPLISIDTLQVLSAQAVDTTKEDALYCAMIDARRMEVYTAMYNRKLEKQNAIEALVIDENSISRFSDLGKIYFFGDGMPKCKELLSQIRQAYFLEAITPSSKFMAQLAQHKFESNDFENTAYFEPFYLKNFVAGQPKSKI